MSTTYSHSNSVAVNVGGQREKVANPSVPSSDKSAFYYSPLYLAKTAIAFGTASYKVTLPAGAFIDSISAIVTAAFSTGATVEVGTTAGASDVLAAESLTTIGSTSFGVTNVSPTATTLFITITNAPTVGAGFLNIRYSH